MIAYLGLLMAALAVPAPAAAQGGGSTPAPPLDNPLGLPDLRGVLPAAQDAQAVSSTVQILVVMTVLALVPSILIMTTSFTRILIVLALLRQALGVPQLPPSQVLTAITLFIFRRHGSEAPFRVPLYPVIPIAFCIACVYMLYSSINYVRFAVEFGVAVFAGLAIMALGIPLYFIAKSK